MAALALQVLAPVNVRSLAQLAVGPDLVRKPEPGHHSQLQGPIAGLVLLHEAACLDIVCEAYDDISLSRVQEAAWSEASHERLRVAELPTKLLHPVDEGVVQGMYAVHFPPEIVDACDQLLYLLAEDRGKSRLSSWLLGKGGIWPFDWLIFAVQLLLFSGPLAGWLILDLGHGLLLSTCWHLRSMVRSIFLLFCVLD